MPFIANLFFKYKYSRFVLKLEKESVKERMLELLDKTVTLNFLGKIIQWRL